MTASRNHPFLLTIVLLSLGMRAFFGAPCCLPMGANGPHAGHHAHHAHHGPPSQAETPADDSDPASDPSANPCCSACSPPLPSEPVELIARTAPKSLPEPTPVRSLATRPPFPAYEATGPPTLI
ncbi:MAG: hypothetical protein AAFP79_04270 [Pseudomonadota bacterium]